jgi:hypothetical protein
MKFRKECERSNYHLTPVPSPRRRGVAVARVMCNSKKPPPTPSFKRRGCEELQNTLMCKKLTNVNLLIEKNSLLDDPEGTPRFRGNDTGYKKKASKWMPFNNKFIVVLFYQNHFLCIAEISGNNFTEISAAWK